MVDHPAEIISFNGSDHVKPTFCRNQSVTNKMFSIRDLSVPEKYYMSIWFQMGHRLWSFVLESFQNIKETSFVLLVIISPIFSWSLFLYFGNSYSFTKRMTKTFSQITGNFDTHVHQFDTWMFGSTPICMAWHKSVWFYDDFIKWKHFPCYWSFARGIYRSPVQRPVTRSFDAFLDLRRNTRLSKQWRGWWFETPSRLSRRHCNVDTKMSSLAFDLISSFAFYKTDFLVW